MSTDQDQEDVNFYKEALVNNNIHFTKLKLELDAEKEYSRSLQSIIEQHSNIPKPDSDSERRTFAAMAMQGLMTREDVGATDGWNKDRSRKIAVMALSCTDELIKILGKN